MAAELLYSVYRGIYMKKLAIPIVAVLMPLLAAADTITLHDGSRHYGTFVGSSGRMITFDETNGARQTYSIDRVQSVEFDSGLTSQSSRRSGIYADRPERPYSDGMTRTLPAGTELSVRT